MSSELDNWAKKYEEATNSDETIGAMAKYYTCSFMFDGKCKNNYRNARWKG